MIKIFHRFHPSKHRGSLKPASFRDRVIAQLIDSIFLSAICSAIIFIFSSGKIYSLWVAPIVPQFILEVSKDIQTDITNFWWGGYFFSVHLPYGKDIFLHYPAPMLWIVYCLYYMLFTIFTNQTPGKMMKRLVVLPEMLESNSSQTSIGVIKSFLRWAAYYLSLAPFGMGFWWGTLGGNKKTWHDKIVRTQVYRF